VLILKKQTVCHVLQTGYETRLQTGI